MEGLLEYLVQIEWLALLHDTDRKHQPTLEDVEWAKSFLCELEEAKEKTGVSYSIDEIARAVAVVEFDSIKAKREVGRKT